MAFMKKKVKEDPINLDDSEIEKKREGVISNAEKTEKKEKVLSWMKMILRIRSDFIEHIDAQIKNKVNATRTSWILEAVQEKMKREIKKNGMDK